MSDQQITLWQGDCLELMARIPDASIDAVVCDLPYGTTAAKWDSVIPFMSLWCEYRRVIKKNGAIVLFGSQPFTSALVMSNPKWFRYSLVWDKRAPVGHLNAKKMPLRRHEDIIIFSPAKLGRFCYNPKMRTGKMRNKDGGRTPSDCYNAYKPVVSRNDQYYPTSIVEQGNAHQSAKVHPTQKPVLLLEYLVKTYTNEGETILDNTMGSGSTGVACVTTGRAFVGIERDETYFEIAQKRICEAATASQDGPRA